MVVYLDDVTVFSRRQEDTICHLKKIFEQCRRYKISLNPKKILFVVLEGKLLEDIVAKSGIKVDLDWVQTITQFPYLVNKKAMQSFLGKINFLRNFISDYAEIVNPMKDMIKKDVVYSCAAVLTQKDEGNDENLISFMSASMQGPEVNYPSIEKQDYAVYKAVKHFRPYLLKNHCIFFLPHQAVRTLLVQKELDDRLARNGIVLKHSSNYYLQGNGLAEPMNKNLIHIIKKTVFSEQRNWNTALTNALWANRVTPKPSLNTSMYFFVYGKEAILPPNIYLPALHLSQELQGKPCQLVYSRMNSLHKLQDERMKEKEKLTLHQNHIKRWFDKKSAGKANFYVGDFVLKWDKPHEDKCKHTKF
eukprot:PITA_04214